jgi:hypothetical protein
VDDTLTRTIALQCSVEHAFDVFTRMVDLWWPRGHRRTREASLHFDPVTGGRLIERAADGSEWTMAEVRRADPPRFLSLDWFPGSPAAPTAVEISFAATPTGTEITVVHRALTAEAKSIWPQRVTRFAEGWERVLPALREFTVEEDN